ncbi:hypothetical protein H7U19_16575 [Hyunsoonleella sp. SJ7]|uniref:Uncharacterized protein n=1 Tax=Hyunsoonleella aquatilis TaxID=2762758 RepID=A0A923KJD1_9FLAO|nr:hypothetical protein [Hyunsoonleella aquatilis]MBC3760029.1 hypothetical protein [Hyunsoonleella aquatilis]
MIKFFRKIRQNLLSENKFRKYLIYAIGEIILVVIGILIALQIGDLNEERKKQDKGKELKQALKIELKADLESLYLDLKYIEDELSTNISYSERLSKETSTLDTLVKIVRYEYIIGLNNVKELNKTTFKSLESTGTINLIGNELSKNVQEYYLYRDYTKEIFSINLGIYFNLLEPFMLKYPNQTFALKGKLQDEYWKSQNLGTLNGMFNGLLTVRLHNLNVQKRYVNETIDRTKSLINRLK